MTATDIKTAKLAKENNLPIKFTEELLLVSNEVKDANNIKPYKRRSKIKLKTIK